MTQTQLAQLARCSRSMVQLLEAGYGPERSPTRDRIERVLDELIRNGQPSPAATTKPQLDRPELRAPAGDPAVCELSERERGSAG
jgi:transcriptional regulator with XRE-family HTH domain